ncbi:MAG: hypothetical protein EXQ69_06700 [Acidimicrobiia bacterium]|nr:hypothetical protein [Acidimicrobiia bacterium]
MDGVSALRFSSAVRLIGAAARAAGLTVPSFRSPPRLQGERRTIRRFRGGTAIAVRIRGRAYDDVFMDMVEGLLLANNLEGATARSMRVSLLDSVRHANSVEVAKPSAPSLCAEARMAERQTQAA